LRKSNIDRFVADASLISVSQNDNGRLCQTKEELAIVRAEGGAPMAPMMRAINFIADAIADEFPVRKTLISFAPLYTSNDDFTKPGSGQI
jgi:hypothetical protein